MNDVVSRTDSGETEFNVDDYDVAADGDDSLTPSGAANATTTTSNSGSASAEDAITALAIEHDVNGDGYLDEAEFVKFMSALLQLELSLQELLMLMIIFGSKDTSKGQDGHFRVKIDNGIPRMLAAGVIVVSFKDENDWSKGFKYQLNLGAIEDDQLSNAFWIIASIVLDIPLGELNELNADQLSKVLAFIFPHLSNSNLNLSITILIMVVFGDGETIGEDGIGLLFSTHPFTISNAGFIGTDGNVGTDDAEVPGWTLTFDSGAIFSNPILLSNYLTNAADDDGVLTLQELRQLLPGLDDEELLMILSIYGTTDENGNPILDLNGIVNLSSDGIFVSDGSGLFTITSVNWSNVSADTIFFAVIRYIAKERGVDPSEVTDITQKEFMDALNTIFGSAAGDINPEVIQQLFVLFGSVNADDDNTNSHPLTVGELYSLISGGAVKITPTMGGFQLTFDVTVTPPKPEETEQTSTAQTEEEFLEDQTGYTFSDVSTPEEDPVDGELTTSTGSGVVVEYPFIQRTDNADSGVAVLEIPAEPSGDGSTDIVLVDEPTILYTPGSTASNRKPVRTKIDKSTNMQRVVNPNGTVTWTITAPNGDKVKINTKEGSELDLYLSDYKSYLQGIEAGLSPMEANSKVVFTHTDDNGNEYTIYAPNTHQFGSETDVARGGFITFNGEVVSPTSSLIGTDASGNTIILYEFITSDGLTGTVQVVIPPDHPVDPKPFINLMLQSGTVIQADYTDDLFVSHGHLSIVQSFFNIFYAGDMNAGLTLPSLKSLQEDDEFNRLQAENGEAIWDEAQDDGIGVSGRVLIAIGAVDEGEVDPNGLYFIANTERNVAILRHYGVLGKHEKLDMDYAYDIPPDHPLPPADADTSHIPPLSSGGRSLQDAEEDGDDDSTPPPDDSVPYHDDPENMALVLDPFQAAHGQLRMSPMAGGCEFWERNIIVGTDLQFPVGFGRQRVRIRFNGNITVEASARPSIVKQLMIVYPTSSGFKVMGEVSISLTINTGYRGFPNELFFEPQISILSGFRLRADGNRQRSAPIFRPFSLRRPVFSANQFISDFSRWAGYIFGGVGAQANTQRGESNTTVATSWDARLRVVFTFNIATGRWELTTRAEIVMRHGYFLDGPLHSTGVPFWRNFFGYGDSRPSGSDPSTHNRPTGMAWPSFPYLLAFVLSAIQKSKPKMPPRTQMGFWLIIGLSLIYAIFNPSEGIRNGRGVGGPGGGDGDGGAGGGGGSGTGTQLAEPGPQNGTNANAGGPMPLWLQTILGITGDNTLEEVSGPAALPTHGDISTAENQSITVNHYTLPPQAGPQSQTTVANGEAQVTIVSHTVGGTTYYYLKKGSLYTLISNAERKKIIAEAKAAGLQEETMTYTPGHGTAPGVLTIVDSDGTTLTVIGNFSSNGDETVTFQMYENGEYVGSITYSPDGQLTVTAVTGTTANNVPEIQVVFNDNILQSDQPPASPYQIGSDGTLMPNAFSYTSETNAAGMPTISQVITVVNAEGQLIQLPVILSQDPDNPDTWIGTVTLPGINQQIPVTLVVGQPFRIVIDGIVMFLELDASGNVKVHYSASPPQATHGTQLTYDDGNISGQILSVTIDPVSGNLVATVLTSADQTQTVTLGHVGSTANPTSATVGVQNVTATVDGQQVEVTSLTVDPTGTSYKVFFNYLNAENRIVSNQLAGVYFRYSGIVAGNNPVVLVEDMEEVDEPLGGGGQITGEPLQPNPNLPPLYFDNGDVSGTIQYIEYNHDDTLTLFVKTKSGQVIKVRVKRTANSSDSVYFGLEDVYVFVDGRRIKVNAIKINQTGQDSTVYIVHSNNTPTEQPFSLGDTLVETGVSFSNYDAPTESGVPIVPMEPDPFIGDQMIYDDGDISGEILYIQINSDGTLTLVVMTDDGKLEEIIVTKVAPPASSNQNNNNGFGIDNVYIIVNGKRVKIESISLDPSGKSDFVHVSVMGAEFVNGRRALKRTGVRFSNNAQPVQVHNAYEGGILPADTMLFYTSNVTFSNGDRTVSGQVVKIVRDKDGKLIIYVREPNGKITKVNHHSGTIEGDDGSRLHLVVNGKAVKITDITVGDDGNLIINYSQTYTLFGDVQLPANTTLTYTSNVNFSEGDRVVTGQVVKIELDENGNIILHVLEENGKITKVDHHSGTIQGNDGNRLTLTVNGEEVEITGITVGENGIVEITTSQDVVTNVTDTDGDDTGSDGDSQLLGGPLPNTNIWALPMPEGSTLQYNNSGQASNSQVEAVNGEVISITQEPDGTIVIQVRTDTGEIKTVRSTDSGYSINNFSLSQNGVSTPIANIIPNSDGRGATISISDNSNLSFENKALPSIEGNVYFDSPELSGVITDVFHNLDGSVTAIVVDADGNYHNVELLSADRTVNRFADGQVSTIQKGRRRRVRSIKLKNTRGIVYYNNKAQGIENGVIRDINVDAQGHVTATVVDKNGVEHQVVLLDEHVDAFASGNITIKRGGKDVHVKSVKDLQKIFNPDAKRLVLTFDGPDGATEAPSANIRFVRVLPGGQELSYYGFSGFTGIRPEVDPENNNLPTGTFSGTFVDTDHNAIVNVGTVPTDHNIVTQTHILDPATGIVYEVNLHSTGQIEIAVLVVDPKTGEVTRQSVYTEDNQQGLVVYSPDGKVKLRVTRGGPDNGIVIETEINGSRFNVVVKRNGNFFVDTKPPGDTFEQNNQEGDQQGGAQQGGAQQGGAQQGGDQQGGDVEEEDVSGQVVVEIDPEPNAGTVAVIGLNPVDAPSSEKPQPQPTFKFVILEKTDSDGKKKTVKYRYSTFYIRHPIVLSFGLHSVTGRVPGSDANDISHEFS